MRPYTRYLVRAAAIAALYAAATLLVPALSFGPWQFRLSEALTLLPVLTPAAVPGLFLGCVLANLFAPTPFLLLDIVFGSLATLLAALATRALRAKPLLAAAPPVLLNALIVGGVLAYAYNLPFFLTALEVGLGELGACYALGLPLLAALKRLPASLWG